MQRTFSEEFKFQMQHGGMHIRLIIVNLIVFLAITLVRGFGIMSGPNSGVEDVLASIFTLQTDFGSFIRAPWGLVTSIFAHFDFIHFLMNMLLLYFIGQMYQQFFSNRRMLHTYLVGGMVGGLIEVLIHLAFPNYQVGSLVVGASGSVIAIFMSLVFYRPNLEVRLFGIIPIKLIYIGLIYLVSDIIGITKNDGIAHFAHLGGILVGFLAVQKMHSSANIINISETMGQKWKAFWSNLFSGKKKAKMSTMRGGKKTDEQYNLDKKANQAKIDAILDKISKSGYDSLSKAEKDFLFSQSKNG